MAEGPVMPLTQVSLKCPAFDNTRGAPKMRGLVRGEGETLEYQDPRDEVFKPAVRLADIRARLVQDYPPSKYIHKKEHGFDATDVTTFLEKDEAFGGDREHRAPLLFQIFPTNDNSDRGPRGFMMDGDRIVLDTFDHGIREFPGILPKCLSSEIAGYDLMHYFRQDKNISLYDIIARQPNGYHEENGAGIVTWHEGPPRYGTVGMRATRFRLHAGLLTWKNRMGSDARNTKILSFIPAECKDPRVNSTKSFRDLTQDEMEAVANVLKGTAPSRAPKVKKNKKNDAGNQGEVDEPSGFADISDNDDNALEGSSTDSDIPVMKRARRASKSPGQNNAKNTRSIYQKTKSTARRNVVMPGHQPTRGTFSVNNVNRVMNSGGNGNSAARNSQHYGQQSTTIQTTEPTNNQTIQRTQADPRYISQEESNLVGSNDPILARLANSFIYRRQNLQIAPATSSESVPSDFRYVVPNAPVGTGVEENITAIQDALELSRMDFWLRTGWHPPPSLKEDHKDETYTRQHHVLQSVFAQCWADKGNGGMCPRLFLLGEWHDSFRNWKIESQEAQRLYVLAVEFDRIRQMAAGRA